MPKMTEHLCQTDMPVQTPMPMMKQVKKMQLLDELGHYARYANAIDKLKRLEWYESALAMAASGSRGPTGEPPHVRRRTAWDGTHPDAETAAMQRPRRQGTWKIPPLLPAMSQAPESSVAIHRYARMERLDWASKRDLTYFLQRVRMQEVGSFASSQDQAMCFINVHNVANLFSEHDVQRFAAFMHI